MQLLVHIIVRKSEFKNFIEDQEKTQVSIHIHTLCIFKCLRKKMYF